jgi:hypothetical protein
MAIHNVYASVSYKGFDSEKDEAIRKALRAIGVRKETGSGYSLVDGERDIGFAIKEEKKEKFKKTIEQIGDCKVEFYPYEDE